MDLNKSSHLNICFPQWQGSGHSNVLYHGAGVLENYLNHLKFDTVKVPESETLCISNGILGYESIVSQHNAIHHMINTNAPETIFIVGGDCGVELGPVSYLNKMYSNLTLIWFDAHADLNTPLTSPSKHFHGMPLRTLCNEGDTQIIEKCFSTLLTDQIILAGAREFDDAELDFINQNTMTQISVDDMETDSNALSNLLKIRGCDHVYLHIDLDVLDPLSYKNIKHPTPNGLPMETLIQAIDSVSKLFNVVGMGITEYVPNKFLPDKKNNNQGLSQIKSIADLFLY